jgi:streptogramin lyase
VSVDTTGSAASSTSTCSQHDPDGVFGTHRFTNGPGPVIGTGSSIGRITVGGAVSGYGDPGLESPGAITPGPDGRMWFTDNAAIGRISTSLTS